MKDFDIAKYLREHQLGSYGILNHYVDLKPLKEEDDTTEVELNTEIPYAGPDNKLTGNGEGDAFDQAETVSEDYEDEVDPETGIPYMDDDITPTDRIEGLINQKDLRNIQVAIQNILDDLTDDGFGPEDVVEFISDKIRRAAVPYLGNKKGDAFDQAETISEDYDNITSDRIMDIGGRKIEQGIIMLMDDGFPAEDVMELCRMFIQDQYGAKAKGTPY